MELEHQFTVPASVEVTWAAFNDPGRVAPCFPGATLISVEGDEFTGSAKIKLGPIALQYNGTGRYVERDESAHRAVIEAKGKDKRGNGTANATVTAQLSAAGDATSVHVTTDLAVTGKPAQFGRGVMQDVSDKLLEQFVTCLQATLGEPRRHQVSGGGLRARATNSSGRGRTPFRVPRQWHRRNCHDPGSWRWPPSRGSGIPAHGACCPRRRRGAEPARNHRPRSPHPLRRSCAWPRCVHGGLPVGAQIASLTLLLVN